MDGDSVLRHRWDISPKEAVRIQERLRSRVRTQPLPHAPRTIGGLDVHENRGAVIVLTWPDLKLLTGAIVEHPTTFPYIPGLLSFREMPALLAAIQQLEALPDLFLCDGHGLAHPRHFGLACHLGVWLGCPTVGCAKSHLRGRYAELGAERGAAVPLCDEQVIGAVVRTQANVRPVYVSIGHLVSLEDAIHVALWCASRYRLPEPLRIAHAMAKTGSYPHG
jgi:deoxyribonuclease V